MLEKASQMAARYNSDMLSLGLRQAVRRWRDRQRHRRDGRGLCRPAGLEAAIRCSTPERFAEIAVEADRRGLQIAVHAIGDGAVRIVLDGYEAALKANGRRDSPPPRGACGGDPPRRHSALCQSWASSPRCSRRIRPAATACRSNPISRDIGEKRWQYAFAWKRAARRRRARSSSAPTGRSPTSIRCGPSSPP